jgi:hypothetical protein
MPRKFTKYTKRRIKKKNDSKVPTLQKRELTQRVKYITFPLVADNVPPTRPYALIFLRLNEKNKGIRARFEGVVCY